MLIPQFTTRFLLKLTAALAFVSLLMASAVRGQRWAIGAISGILYLMIFLLLSALSLAIVGAFTRFAARRRQNKDLAKQ